MTPKNQLTTLNKVLIFLFIINKLVFGLEFTIHENNSFSLNAIKAMGKIEINDSEKLHKYLSALKSKKHIAIYLNSGGGSLYGGMQLGRYFKKHHIKTVIEGYSICASACALAFLGGRDYKGEKWMSSTTTSKLGFHSFSYTHSKYEDMDRTQKTVSDILKYGQYINANRDIFIKLFATSSSDMYWFTIKETLDFNIKVWDIKNGRFLKELKYLGQESKIEFIKRYFTEIKKISYRKSWNKLNISMKKATTFTKYKKWWSKSVKRIQVLDTKLINKNKVRIKLLYTMKNGKKRCSLDTFILENKVNTWFISTQKYKSCSY